MKDFQKILNGPRWSQQNLELWGGVECTLNRVGETYFDQLAYNGHRDRISDLDAFAKLGIKRLRAPFLWEQHVHKSSDEPDWTWAKERLLRMKQLGIEPIAGLLHHGSGPRDTSLLDPAFPDKFAHYARSFAEAFPEVIDYTPINEPLTTARFSCLYGKWYPHRKSTGDFARALMHQLQATALAMKEIRKVQPNARLIQTEDLGETSGSSNLDYQIDHENERRWLTLDILTGNFTDERPLYEFLLKLGISKAELQSFVDHPTPPQIYGINHYVTSNRYLDSNLNDYPARLHGGNKRHNYVDVEAARVGDTIPVTLDLLLREAWNRYRIPLAITEAHLDCTREEQMRWFKYVWKSCETARLFKVDVRAVTAWGLLGHYDWNCHVTSCRGYYESGVYDLRGPEPRPTALAAVIADYAKGHKPENPVLEPNGWWARPTRAHFRRDGVAAISSIVDQERPHFGPSYRPLLVVGDQTGLSREVVRACDERALPYVYLNGAVERMADNKTLEQSVTHYVERFNPWAMIDARAEGNLLGKMRGLRSLSFSLSSTLPPDASDPRALVIQTGTLFSATDKNDLPSQWLSQLLAGQQVEVSDGDEMEFSYVPDVVRTALNFFIDGEQGLWPLVHSERPTPYTFLKRLGQRIAFSGKLFAKDDVDTRTTETSAAATLPRNFLPKLDDALERYVWESAWIPAEQKIYPVFEAGPVLELRKGL